MKSVTLAGTLMHRSHVPIRLWFWAAYRVATHAPGISALPLQRQLGIKQNATVWFLLHRLRKGMVRQDRELLKVSLRLMRLTSEGPPQARGAEASGQLKQKL